MRVFLVYVRDEAYFHLLPPAAGDAGADPRVRVMAFPPLGIQTLAPVLRRAGHSVRMFDTCHPGMRVEDVSACARQERPDVIALSFLSVTAYPALRRFALEVKSENPAVPIIVGGAFASINAREILADCPFIDHVGVGEGEELLLDYLENLRSPGKVAGLVWRDGGEVVRNAPRPLIQDLDAFPYPDRTSLPIDYVESLPLDVPAVLSLDRFCTMQTSRGCPYTCIYCDIPSLAGGRWRSRSAEHVLGEMQELSDQGYRSIYLTDDHFLLKRQRIADICNGIIDRKLAFRWGCEGRVDSVGVDQLPLMGRARCDMLAYGVESGTQKMLDRLGKRQRIEQIEHAVGEAKRHGIARVHGFFVIGSPGETAEDIRETFRFAARLPLDTFGFNRLAVYRGTPLWSDYARRGLVDDVRDWDKTFKCCDIDPDALPNDEVNALRMKGYASLLLHRVLRRPLATLGLLRTFARHMPLGDLFRLIRGPFRRTTAPRPALPAPMVDAGIASPVRPGAAAACGPRRPRGARPGPGGLSRRAHPGYKEGHFATTSVRFERSPTEKEATVKQLAAGSLVKHRTLGTGRIVAVEATALHVFFPASETRYAAKLRWPAAGVFLSTDTPESDPWLEGLTSFAMDSTSGRYALAANFVSQDEAVQTYLADHPTGFHLPTSPKRGAPHIDRRTRWRTACAAWTASMGDGQAGALLEDGNHAELALRLVRVAASAAAVPGMIEVEVLQEAFEPGDEVRHFLDALFGYLSVPSPARARFDKLSAASNALGIPPEAAWPMVTFFPFVAMPSRHVLLLPRSACAGASRLGCDLQYQVAPTWTAYVRLRDLSTRLLEKLQPSGARDHVDVESFLHATGSRRPATAAKRATAAPAAATTKGARAAPRRTR